MSGLKRLWTRIVGIFEALEGMDDPTGDYMLSLGKRVDKLERGLEHLEGQLHSGGRRQRNKAGDNSSNQVSRSLTDTGQ